MNVLKVEFLKYKIFFMSIFSIEIILDICTAFKLISFDGDTDTVYLLWQMLSWIAIIFYITYNCCGFFVFGKDKLAHLLPARKQKVLILKMFVFTVYILIYFTMQLIRYLICLPSTLTTSSLKLAFICIISKVVSIIAFFTILYLLLSICKLFTNNTVGIIISVCIYCVLSFLQWKFVYGYINSLDNMDWIIGIVSGMKGINQYINIIPVIFMPKDGAVVYVEENFNVISVVLNLVITVASCIISYIINRFFKFDYV